MAEEAELPVNGTPGLYAIALQGFLVEASSPKDLDRHLDDVTEALGTLDDILDSSVGASLAKGVVDIELTIHAESREDALHKSLILVRTAIHVAGGATHGWDAELLNVQVRKANVSPGDLIDA